MNNLLHLILLLRLLLVMCLLLTRILVRSLVRRIGRHHRLAAGKVNVDPAGVFLRGILQTQFAADSLDARLDLLDMAGGVIALADDSGSWISSAHPV